MDPQAIYLLAVLFIFLFIVVRLKRSINLKKTNCIPNIPPGPWKLPILGNLPLFIGCLPHHKLRDLANKYGPLMHLQLGEVFFIVVSSAEYAQEVMRNRDVIFAFRPHLLAAEIVFYDSTSIGFSPYGDYWKQLRKICNTELFCTNCIQSQWLRLEVVNDLIKMIATKEGSVINLSEAVKSVMFTITSTIAFGKKYREQEEFILLKNQVVSMLAAGFFIGDLFPSAKWFHKLTGMRTKLEKLHRKIDRILEIIVNDHREGVVGGDEDLIHFLLKYENSSDLDFSLTRENIKAIILDVFIGGSDSAGITVSWAMTEMMKNPRMMERAQGEVREVFESRGRVDETCIDELKYMKAVIREVLRLHPPGPLLIPRECGQECEINGYHIPFKSRVIVNAWAIARDPKYWTGPEIFNPDRFLDSSIDYKGTNFEFLPFGAGRRICPGMNFGVANVELTFALLLYHFDWKLPKGVNKEDLDMAEGFGAAVVRKDDLYVTPITYPSLLVS